MILTDDFNWSQKYKTSNLTITLRHNSIKSFICIKLSSIIALPQSDHYWSQIFNVGSSLLSGAVVDDKARVSTIDYNPVQIGLDTTLKFSFSENLISIQFYNIENFAGDEVDMFKLNLKLQSKFISYVHHYL